MKSLLNRIHARVGDLFKRRACPLADDLLSYGHAGNIRESADGRQGTDECRDLHSFASARERALSDFSRIRVLAEALATQSRGNSDCSPRDTLRILKEVAVDQGLLIDSKAASDYGELVSKRTGESSVYFNATEHAYYKLKCPSAKSAIKQSSLADWPYEHIIHNILFPETAYEFIGVSVLTGEIAFLLKQEEIQSETFPEDSHISSYLQSLGLTPEDRYFFGNTVLAVTDVSARGDNVLLNDEGKICFIDPLIRLKRPAIEVIDWLVGDFPS